MIYYFVLLLGIPIVSARPENITTLNERSFYGDPKRGITCLGSHYDLQLPLRSDGSDPNELTMQELCAKTIYGGAPAGDHLGGWCSKGLPTKVEGSEDTDDDEEPEGYGNSELTGVSFDLSPNSHADLDTADPRFLLGCFNRCFCNYGVTDLTIQPKRSEPSNADVYMKKSRGTGEILLDVTDDVTTSDRIHDGRLGDVEVEYVELDELIEPNEEKGFAISRETHDPPWALSLDAGNYITCEGDLPSFPLPQPYPVSEFQNPQELCAVQWSGGKS